MKYATLGITTAALLLAASVTAQVAVPADRTATIESGGPDGSDFYAQFANGSFDEYSLAEFNISKADFGGSSVTALNSVALRLTVNDRFFSATGPFSIFFTTDSLADLTTTSDYDALSFTPAEPFGIDPSVYTYAPVAVAAGTYDESLVPGGSTLDVTIDLTPIGADLLSAINAGDSVHFLLGVESSSGTVATFSGVGNTFDPGDPTLIIDATTSGPVPEPNAYPTGFTATPQFRNVELTWTDSADTVGYLVAISDDPTITAPVDGVEPVDDLDLSDGEGAIVVPQGVEAAEFLGLAENTQYYFSIFPYSNSGTETDYKTDGSAPTSTATTTETPTGVIITQYYEGSSGNNKYIELSNTTASPIDMSDYILTTWSDAATEDWKTSGNTTARTTEFTDITLAPGASIVVANPDSVTPLDAADADVSTGEATFFNGEDSAVLYATSNQDPTNIVDALPFTNDGKEGLDTGFVRIATTAGYDLVAGSSVLDFPSVWQQVDNTITDAAVFGDDAFLGTSDLVTPPPSVFFDPTSLLVNEGDGTVDLTIEIQNPDGNPVAVDIVFDAGDGVAEAGDIGNYTTQTVNFPDTATSGDQQTVTITITDDAIEEVTEAAAFSLQNLVSAGNAIIGSASTATINIQDNDTVIPNVFISEVVDPSDNAGDGRYVELYNPTGSAIDLGAGAWHLVMYFNANTSGTDIPLTGVIPAGGTYIVAESASFGTVYSTTEAEAEGNLNFNGDDNLELRYGGTQTTGVLVDVYGQPGTQGAGLAWEFADSRAVRLDSVTNGSATWDSAEWAILPAAVADATPRTHPETIVTAPTGVTATALSESEIEIAFAPAGSNDVLVVFNQTGSFTDPSGTPPAVGQPFAGGTVLSLGTTSPTLHSGLASETEYFYALYTYDGTDYSNGVQVSATTPIAGLINSEDFSGTPDWFNDSVSGDDPWDLSRADAFIDGALTLDSPEVLDNHYLVSPELDFSSTNGITITFDYAGSYDVPGLESLELLYSTDYSGDAATATWVPISFDFTNITDALEDVVVPDDFLSSGAVDLPATLEGQSGIRLAFRYNNVDGTVDNSEQWVIDNILLQAGTTTPPSDPLDDYLSGRGLSLTDLELDTNGNGLTVIEEYLFGIDDGDEASSAVLGFDPATGALTLTSDLETDPAGVTVELLATSDLTVGFSSVPFTTSSVDNSDGTFTRSYTETNPPAESDSRFYQLQITVEAQ